MHVLNSYTLFAVPAAAPSNLTAYGTSSTTIKLQWSKIPKFYSNGNISYYSINQTEIPTGRKWIQLVRGDTVGTEHRQLKKFTNYSFRIAGINDRGIGLYSLSVPASTQQDGK